MRFFHMCLMLMTMIIFAERTSADPASLDTENARVGVLFSSYGDIDDPREARDFVFKTLTDPDVLPLPALLRTKIAIWGWALRQDQILASYRAIGGRTNYRAVSQKAADLVAQLLRRAGLDAVGYVGFTFTFPFMQEALEKARRDGVTHLIVLNQGAQYSRVTTGIEFRDIKKYLNEHPSWQVRVLGIKQFSNDRRFADLIAESIHRRINRSFADVSPEELCIFLPLHGNLMQWIEAGDPSYQQMLGVVRAMKNRFPNHIVSYGFLNHDEMPFFPWTQPKDSTALHALVERGCRNILINGRITFTVDSIESLHDQAILERNAIQKASQTLGLVPPRITVESMFNLEPDFISFQSQIVKEALRGQGDLEVLR